MADTIQPDHMDAGSRNARLYQHLKAMGLYVIPVFADEAQTQIDHFHVSAALPAYLLTEQPAQGGDASPGRTVPLPMPSAKIVSLVRPTEGRGEDVIDMPSVRAVSPVFGPRDDATVAINPE